MQDKNTTSVYNENIVQEIMGLVDALSVECIAFGIAKMASSAENQAILGDDVKKSRALLQSKLRELVENKFSVQEPLSVEYPDGYNNPFARISYDAGWRAAERAYNITSGITFVRKPVEKFFVKHYHEDERPSIKGNGFDGLEIGETREEAQKFIDFINDLV